MRKRFYSLFLFLPVLDAGATSFDCNKAQTATEKTICSNTELGQLDERLAAIYKTATNQLPEHKSNIRQQQRYWISARDSLCRSDVDCLTESYREQIRNLENSLRESLESNTCSNTYLNPHVTAVINDNDWEEVMVQDVMTFRKLDKSQAIFELQTVGANGHQCSFYGVADKRKNHWRWDAKIHGEIDSSLKECALEFKQWEGDYMSVRLPEDASDPTKYFGCYQHYCGTRGNIPTGAIFIAADKLMSDTECKEFLNQGL